MHESKNVRLGCCDCHGGDPCATTKEAAHVHPKFPDVFKSSRNPERTYAILNLEYPQFLRFINPVNYRHAAKTCGTACCHPQEAQIYLNSVAAYSTMAPHS